MTARCIMVVDDDPDDVELFIEAVRDIDPTVLCQQARNGMEALTLLKSNCIKPEIIFVDLICQSLMVKNLYKP
ncbi:MAG TPA: hypothetical protein VFW11_14585 [Cyclobacteriaceae bacterium]|nr:hypothetical protein [Cyclobacteriaceae bacterium]